MLRTVSACLLVVGACAIAPENLASPNCNSCAAAAAPGQTITWDPICVAEGGLGCISSSPPDQEAEYRGCRYCGFPPFESISCENDVCTEAQALQGQGQFLIEESCDSCSAKAGFLDPIRGIKEMLTYDEACLADHGLDDHGGLGCIAVSAPNDPNVKFSGCRYCGFNQYSPVNCATSMCPSTQEQFLLGQTEDCNTCQAKAGAGERLTHDESCFEMGGLGCVSTSAPGARPNFNGCRHCEYGAFSMIPCNTATCQAPPMNFPQQQQQQATFQQGAFPQGAPAQFPRVPRVPGQQIPIMVPPAPPMPQLVPFQG